jgi:hypothetical protein
VRRGDAVSDDFEVDDVVDECTADARFPDDDITTEKKKIEKRKEKKKEVEKEKKDRDRFLTDLETCSFCLSRRMARPDWPRVPPSRLPGRCRRCTSVDVSAIF